MKKQKKSCHSDNKRTLVSYAAGLAVVLIIAGGIYLLFFTYADGEENALHDPHGLMAEAGKKGSIAPEFPWRQGDTAVPGVNGTGSDVQSAIPDRTRSGLSGSPDEDFPEELDDLSYYAPVPVEFPSRGRPRSEPPAEKQTLKQEAAVPSKEKAVPKAGAGSSPTAPSYPASRKDLPSDTQKPASESSILPANRAANPKQEYSTPLAVSKSGSQEPAVLAGKSVQEVAAMLSTLYSGQSAGQWGENVKGVVRRLDDAVFTHTLWPDTGKAGGGPVPFVLALTFDACDGAKNRFDAELIAFLRERRIPATLFVTSTWMRRYKQEMQDLASDPLFEIAAHGERHRPCSVDGKSAFGIKGTSSMPELTREVLVNARDIERVTGRWPAWFRSGTAHYDELAVRVIGTLGMRVAGYSIAGDQGATLPAAKVAGRLEAAENGDIFLFHMNKPESGTREGLKRALPSLQEKGAVFIRLSDTL